MKAFHPSFVWAKDSKERGAVILKKNWTWLAVLAAAGTVIGLVIAYFCKKKDGEYMEDQADEEEDFELDSDLKPVSEREYVPLKKRAETVQKEEAPEKEEAEAASEEEEKKEPDAVK